MILIDRYADVNLESPQLNSTISFSIDVNQKVFDQLGRRIPIGQISDKIRRQGSDHAPPGGGSRMSELERQRMQRLASKRPGLRFRFMTVEWIAETWMTDRGEMYPNLMGPAGRGHRTEEGRCDATLAGGHETPQN